MHRRHRRPVPTVVTVGCALAATAFLTTGCVPAAGDPAVESPTTPTSAPIAEPVSPAAQPPVAGEAHAYTNPYLGGFEDLSDYRRILYTLPPGWETRDEFVGKHLGSANQVAISFWTSPGLFPDACHREGTKLARLELWEHDHSADGAILVNPEVAGLGSQDGRDATEPVQVPIGGQVALRMELSVPTDLDVGGCDDGVYRSWPAHEQAWRGNDDHVPGQVDVIYQVDVDRMPLIIDASYRPTSSEADRAELDAVLQSLSIER